MIYKVFRLKEQFDRESWYSNFTLKEVNFYGSRNQFSSIEEAEKVLKAEKSALRNGEFVILPVILTYDV